MHFYSFNRPSHFVNRLDWVISLLWRNQTIHLRLTKLRVWIPDPSHFIFDIHVGKRRIRRRGTLNLNCNHDVICNWVGLEIHHWIWESLHVGSASFRHRFEKYNGLVQNYHYPYEFYLLWFTLCTDYNQLIFPSKSLYFIFMKNWFLLWRSCPDFDSNRGNGLNDLNQNQGWNCGKLYWNTKKDSSPNLSLV